MLILKTIFKPIKILKAYEKLFTLVCGVLFAMFANAATLDIGEPNNNVKDGETVWYDATTKLLHSMKLELSPRMVAWQ